MLQRDIEGGNMLGDLDCSIKRYFNIFVVKPRFLLILLVIPLFFYIYTLLYPVSYEISNSIAFPEDIILDLPGEKNEFINRDMLTREPELFFLNTAFMAELNHLITRSWEMEEPGTAVLAGNVMRSLALESSGKDILTVKYTGSQLSAGELMVYFYSRKLISHSFEPGEGGMVSAADKPMAGGAGFLKRDLDIRKNYSFWDQRRLRPLAYVTVLSFLFMLFVVGMVDWMDSSLKDESQAARYLDLPVLGSFPNIIELGSSLDRAADLNRQSPGKGE